MLIVAALITVEKLRQPERHARPDVHEGETDTDNDHVRHHASEDLIQRHVLGRYSLEIEGRHRHRRRQECRLQIDRNHGAEQDRVDFEMAQQRDEDRTKDHDDLGPFERPTKQENNYLRNKQESQRRQVHAKHPALDQTLAAVQREHGGEKRRADEQPAHHRGCFRRKKCRFLHAGNRRAAE